MIDIKTLKAITGTMRVIYVEDDEGIRAEMGAYLNRLFKSVTIAENGKIALQLYLQNTYDIVITDISMPIMNGLEMSQEILKINEQQEIIIVSAYSKSEYFTESIQLGISGYIIKPMDFNQIQTTLYKSARKVHAIKEAEDYKHNLMLKVQERTAELKEALEKESTLKEFQTYNYQKTIYSFVDMIDRRDAYTAGHSKRVADYSKMIAQEMDYSKEDCELIYQAAMLHDIGKIVIADAILLKPEALNNFEYAMIKEHVNFGYELLHKIPMYEDLAEIMLYHHERHDGTGYPKGLKGDEIPEFSRIIAVADAFDAMTTNRIYKDEKNLEYALIELEKFKGLQFHPSVINSALKTLKNVSLNININQLPVNELDEQRFAYFFKDPLTRVNNIRYLEIVLANNLKNKVYTYASSLSLKNFIQHTDTLGWKKADELLKEIVNTLQESFQMQPIFRLEAYHFLILSDRELKISMQKLELIQTLQENNIVFEISEMKLDDTNATNIFTLKENLS